MTIQAPTPSSTSTADARIEILVAGMTCASCVRHIEDALRKAPGVKDARVNLVARKAIVTIDPSRTSSAAVARVIVAAGYDVPGAV